MISKAAVLVIAPLVLIPVGQQHGSLSAAAAPGIAREANPSAAPWPQDATRLAQRKKSVDPEDQAGTRHHDAQGTSPTVELAPEQRTRIKEYVMKQKGAPLTFKERVTVGATLPGDVRLSPVPADWGPSVNKYRYIYSDDHVYVVEPSTRKVLTVID